MHVRAVLHHPIMAGDAAIQIAVLDVATHLLRPNQSHLQLLIVHVRYVGTRADGNVVSGLGHFLDVGLLETALRQSELENTVGLLHEKNPAWRVRTNRTSFIWL